jgi:hypothetical protein
MTTHAGLPIEPLYRIAEVRADLHGEDGRGGFTQRLFADMIGTTDRAVTRWFADGRIPWVSADEAAVNLGLHPSLVWGDDWWNVKGDFDQLAAEAEADLYATVVDDLAADGMDDF